MITEKQYVASRNLLDLLVNLGFDLGFDKPTAYTYAVTCLEIVEETIASKKGLPKNENDAEEIAARYLKEKFL